MSLQEPCCRCHVSSYSRVTSSQDWWRHQLQCCRRRWRHSSHHYQWRLITHRSQQTRLRLTTKPARHWIIPDLPQSRAPIIARLIESRVSLVRPRPLVMTSPVICLRRRTGRAIALSVSAVPATMTSLAVPVTWPIKSRNKGGDDRCIRCTAPCAACDWTALNRRDNTSTVEVTWDGWNWRHQCPPTARHIQSVAVALLNRQLGTRLRYATCGAAG